MSYGIDSDSGWLPGPVSYDHVHQGTCSCFPAKILRDNIADAQERPSYGNWAGGTVKQFRRLGMASPFLSSGITLSSTGLNSLGFQADMKGQPCKVWGGLHVSPRTAPSKKRAKLCTYFA